MSFNVQIRRAAELDFAEAQLWYETQTNGLGAEFQAEVTRVLDRLAEAPLIYQIVHRDVHRAVVRRFPYLIWYRVRGDDVTVLACTHGGQDPDKTFSRLLWRLNDWWPKSIIAKEDYILMTDEELCAATERLAKVQEKFVEGLQLQLKMMKALTDNYAKTVQEALRAVLTAFAKTQVAISENTDRLDRVVTRMESYFGDGTGLELDN